jgi:hypothetical protein
MNKKGPILSPTSSEIVFKDQKYKNPLQLAKGSGESEVVVIGTINSFLEVLFH